VHARRAEAFTQTEHAPLDFVFTLPTWALSARLTHSLNECRRFKVGCPPVSHFCRVFSHLLGFRYLSFFSRCSISRMARASTTVVWGSTKNLARRVAPTCTSTCTNTAVFDVTPPWLAGCGSPLPRDSQPTCQRPCHSLDTSLSVTHAPEDG